MLNKNEIGALKINLLPVITSKKKDPGKKMNLL